jgi:catechol 2,3-dioxygenase-like lactoylglutathione lyase family enzyme
MALRVNRIDHVVLNTGAVDAFTDWYVRVLGMQREVFGEGRVALLFGNQKINVQPTGAPNWVTGAVDAPGSLDLCFIAETSRPMMSPYCRDPDGNLIEVASYPRRRLAWLP